MSGKKSVAVMVLSIFVFTVVGWGCGEILKRQTIGTVGGHLKVLVAKKGGGLTDVNVGSIGESLPKAFRFELNYLGSIAVAGMSWFNTETSDKWLRKAIEWDRGTINSPYADKEDILNNSYEYKGNIISGRKAAAVGGAMKIVPILLAIIIGIIAGRFFVIKMSSKK